MHTTETPITDNLTAVGLTLPKAAQGPAATLDALDAHITGLTRTDARQVVPSLTRANLASTLDQLVTEHVEHDARKEIAHSLRPLLVARLNAAIRAEADDLIAKARPGFDALAARLTEAAGHYSPDDDPNTILAKGSDSTAAWETIREITPRIEPYNALWSALYQNQVSRLTAPTHRTRLGVADRFVESWNGDFWQRVDINAAAGHLKRWHLIAHQGLTLRLNTLDEARAVVAATPEKERRDLVGGRR